MRRYAIAALATFALGVSPAVAQGLLEDHPLVDVIVAVDSGQIVTRAELERRLAAADYVLLGEKHDNARHHAIQAELVDALGREARLRAVAFEMLPTDRQAALTDHLTFGGSVTDLDAAVGWAELGWGPWTWYGPIAHAGHRHGATLVAANLSRTDMRTVYSDGLAALDERFVRRTGLDQPLDPEEQAAREARMVEAHCGHDLGPGAAAMVDVQRARDARMGERLATLTGDGQGVLITGNAHADVERGVPRVLATLRPDATVVSLGLIEVHGDLEEATDGDWPYDFVWFTPRANPVDHDYCAGLPSRS